MSPIYVTVRDGVVESVDNLPAGQELVVIDLDIDKDSDPAAVQPHPIRDEGPRCLLDYWPKQPVGAVLSDYAPAHPIQQ